MRNVCWSSRKRLSLLENELNVYAAYNTVDKKIIPELKVLYPAAEAIAMAKTVELQVDSTQTDTLTIVLMKFSKKPVGKEQEKISEWLKARVGAKKLKLNCRIKTMKKTTIAAVFPAFMYMG